MVRFFITLLLDIAFGRAEYVPYTPTPRPVAPLNRWDGTEMGTTTSSDGGNW